MFFAIKDRLVDATKRRGVYARSLREAQSPIEAPDHIPLIDPSQAVSKKELRELGANAKVPFGWRRATTSGTSGSPFLFPQPLSALQREQAYIDSLWFRAGFSSQSRVVVLRGVLVPDGIQRAGDRLIISCDGWSDADIQRKAGAIRQFKPTFIHCYPSLLERFVRRCLALGTPLPQGVLAVLSGSEECTGEQESLFSESLGCPTVAWYGQSEQVALAVKQPDQSYAIVPGYSEVAFVRLPDGFEIAGKSRCNPFFANNWYRTGDTCGSVELGWSPVTQCVTLIMRDLHGRATKQVLLEDGTRMPFNHVIFGLHSQSWLAVDRYAFVQSRPGLLVLVHSLMPGADAESVPRLLSELRRRLPRGLQLEARRVDEINSIASAKWTYFFADEGSLGDLCGNVRTRVLASVAGLDSR